MTTLLNLDYFWLTEAELCQKGTFAKASFMFVTIYENPRRKNFIKPSYLKHPKIISQNKKRQIFIFTIFCGASKRFHFFEAQQEVRK